MLGERIDKVLVSLAFLSLTMVLIIASIVGPASAYEISMYTAYPAYFWLIFMVAFACGIIILVRQAFSKTRSNWWLCGLAIVIITNSIFLLLPQFRGYAFGGTGDELTHLGHMKDILMTGHAGIYDIYPAEHILGVSILFVTGMKLESIPPVFYVLFSSIYLISLSLLAKSVSGTRGQTMLIIAFGSPLVYSVLYSTDIQPQAFSLFMLPCLLFTFHKMEQNPYNRLPYTILSLGLALCITYFHPITTLVAIAILLTFGFSRFIFSRIFRRTSPISSASTNLIPLAFIMFISFCAWYLSFGFIQQSFVGIFEWLFHQVGTPLLEESINLMNLANLTSSQFIWLIINRYGAVFLIFIVSGISSIFLFFRTIFKKSKIAINEFTYAILFWVTTILGGMMALVYYSGGSLFRVFEFSLLIGTLLSGMAIYNYGITRTKRVLTMSLVTMFILSVAILGFANVYYSPWIAIPNGQITWAEKDGKEWILKTHSADIPIMSNSIDMPKFEDYYYGYEYGYVSPGTRAFVDSNRLPSHFGYQEFAQIGAALGGDRYVIITTADVIGINAYPSSARKLVHQWTETDFARLADDPSASEIYVNGGFEVWKVNTVT